MQQLRNHVGNVLGIVVLGSLSIGAFGCAAQHASDLQDENVYADDAAAKKYCPHFVSPVCGKNGKTYSNYCYAGGKSHVAHNGACTTLTCKTVTCASGAHCEMKGLNGGAVPVCIDDSPIDHPTCLTLTCASGYHCEEKGINGGAIAVC